MPFKRALQRYGRTPEPETPYQRAGQLWDERIGSARVQARNWRYMAFGGLALTASLSGTLVWQSTQSRVVPYVVEVDRLGEARAVAPAETQYQPTEPQIAWHLAKFIGNVRSVSLDPVMMRENWLAAYDFATERGALFLGEYARSSTPFAEVGRRMVSVQVTSVVRASDDSFQVRWSEREYERGSLKATARWTAILTVAVKAPRTAEALRKNPLGLYVEAIDWNRELETPAERPPLQSNALSPPEAIPSPSVSSGSPLDPALRAAPNVSVEGNAQ